MILTYPTLGTTDDHNVCFEVDLGDDTTADRLTISVRFAYPQSEIASGHTTDRVERAKTSILHSIGLAMGDLGNFPPAANQAERHEQQRSRARLREAMSGWNSSSPLHIFISTEASLIEARSGHVGPLTDKVHIRLQDIGDPTRLQAAIRMSLTMIQGGIISPSQRLEAASQDVMKRSMLHEVIHAHLIRQSSDATSIWQTHQTQLTIQGSPSVSPLFTELVRKYLIAQEELFA